MNIYTLSEELKVSAEELRGWLRASGLSKGDKVSPRAATLARQRFVVERAPQGSEAHPLAQLFARQDAQARERAAAENEARAPRAQIRERHKPQWGKAEHMGPALATLSPAEQSRAIREMRQGAREESPAPQRSPQVTPPLAPPQAQPQTQPQTPPHASSSEAQSFSETYYKRQYDDLLSKFHAQRERLKRAEVDNKTLKEELEKVEARAPAALSAEQHARAPAPGEGAGEDAGELTPTLIWEELSSFGLIERDAIYALFEALSHPVRGPELLYRLKLDDGRLLLRGFSLICRDEVCAEVAAPRAPMGLIEVSAEQCGVCLGNDNRRWYKRLLQEWRARGAQAAPWLLVGGEEANYEALKLQARECPGLSWLFAPGTQTSTQSAASAQVSQAAGVLVWGGMALPHSMSGHYKSAAQSAGRPCLTIPPGQRSVASICKTLLRHWGVEVEA